MNLKQLNKFFQLTMFVVMGLLITGCSRNSQPPKATVSIKSFATTNDYTEVSGKEVTGGAVIGKIRIHNNSKTK